MLPAWLSNLRWLLDDPYPLSASEHLSILCYFAPIIDRWIDESLDWDPDQRADILCEIYIRYFAFAEWSVIFAKAHDQSWQGLHALIRVSHRVFGLVDALTQ